MSIEKKSLISNRIATKKANLTKASAAQISSPKLGLGKVMVSPQCKSKIATTLIKSHVR